MSALKRSELYVLPSNEDKRIIASKELWSKYPFLPIKRRPGEQAVLWYRIDDNNYYILRSRDARPVWRRTEIAEIIGDGWRVDQ